MGNCREQKSQARKYHPEPRLFQIRDEIQRVAARLESESFDQITAGTLQELARMFQRRNGAEVFKAGKSSFVEALSLITEILVHKALHEKVGKDFFPHQETLDILYFRAFELTGRLCERWAVELVAELDKLHAEYLRHILPRQE